jgi:hypothetical protein
MNIAKYVDAESKAPTAPFAVSLPRDTLSDMDRLRTEHKVKVRAWVRDLIMANLPKLKEELGLDD